MVFDEDMAEIELLSAQVNRRLILTGVYIVLGVALLVASFFMLR